MRKKKIHLELKKEESCYSEVFFIERKNRITCKWANSLILGVTRGEWMLLEVHVRPCMFIVIVHSTLFFEQQKSKCVVEGFTGSCSDHLSPCHDASNHQDFNQITVSE